MRIFQNISSVFLNADRMANVSSLLAKCQGMALDTWLTPLCLAATPYQGTPRGQRLMETEHFVQGHPLMKSRT